MKRYLIAALVVFGSIGLPARSALVEYTIDPAASVLTLSGDFAGAPFQAQNSGSDSVGFFRKFSGDLTANSFTLEHLHFLRVESAISSARGRSCSQTGTPLAGFKN